jgi:hypothetical protein
MIKLDLEASSTWVLRNLSTIHIRQNTENVLLITCFSLLSFASYTLIFQVQSDNDVGVSITGEFPENYTTNTHGRSCDTIYPVDLMSECPE